MAGSRKPGLSLTSSDAGRNSRLEDVLEFAELLPRALERLLLRHDVDARALRDTSTISSDATAICSTVVPVGDEGADLDALLDALQRVLDVERDEAEQPEREQREGDRRDAQRAEQRRAAERDERRTKGESSVDLHFDVRHVGRVEHDLRRGSARWCGTRSCGPARGCASP